MSGSYKGVGGVIKAFGEMILDFVILLVCGTFGLAISAHYGGTNNGNIIQMVAEVPIVKWLVKSGTPPFVPPEDKTKDNGGGDTWFIDHLNAVTASGFAISFWYFLKKLMGVF